MNKLYYGDCLTVMRDFMHARSVDPFELADSTYLVNNSSFWHWNCHTPEEYENRSRARFRRQLSQFENCCNVDASECCRRRFSNT